MYRNLLNFFLELLFIVLVHSDLSSAEFALIKAVQNGHFTAEMTTLSQKKIMKSIVRRLNPFLKDGIIRVGEGL